MEDIAKTVRLACLLVLMNVLRQLIEDACVLVFMNVLRQLTEDDVRRIVREEIKQTAVRVVSDHAAQRSVLMAGVRKP